MGQVWRTFPLNHPQSGLTHFKTGSHDGSVELICGRNRRLEFCIGEICSLRVLHFVVSNKSLASKKFIEEDRAKN